MTALVVNLRTLHRGLARRHAAALAIVALALAAVLFGAGAAAARVGLLNAVRWLPLAVWIALAGLIVAAALRLRDALRPPDAAGLRGTASVVEGELALRRGALVGVVDLETRGGVGTSPALAARAGAAAAAGLPGIVAAWAPKRTEGLRRRMRLAGAGACAAGLAAAFALWSAGDAAAALVSPARALRAAFGPRIAVAVSARSVRSGGSVEVRVRTGPLGRPVLYLRSTGEAWRPMPLTADGEGRAIFTARGLRADLFVYAADGGAVSDTVHVDVVVPPFVTDFAVTARFPAYLARPDEPLLLEVGPVALPTGTVLDIRGAASAPLTRALIGAGTDSIALIVDAAQFRGALVVRGNAAWQLVLTDRAGAPLPGPLPVLEVQAVPDSAPVVSVPIPGADTTAPLDLRAALVVDARDDHGLGRVEVVSWRISRLGVVGDTLVDSLPGVGGADRIVQGQVLDLTRRGLLPGDTLRYFVRATDRAPIPHTGRSREFALRLRSLQDLRDAVREAGDSLAHAAGDLAADQTSLTRRTEDLAAQRNRAGDRPTPPVGARETPPDGRTPPGAMPFEQAEEARRIAEQQQQIAARADSLRQELDQLSRAADEAGLTDPEWRRQLQELEELVRQAVTPELRQRLEELQRAIERLDPQQVQQALRNLAEQQRQLREQLQRSAELFERAALEGTMQTMAQDAQALQEAQERWAREAEARRDSAAAAAQEQQLRAEADSLEQRIEDLRERLEQRGDSAASGELSQTQRSASRAASQMQQAAQAMQRGDRPEAGQRGSEASQSLRDVPQQLREQRQQMANAWRAEVLRAMDDATAETIALAAEEQRLADQLRQGEGSADARGRQSAMEQGVGQVANRLQQAAGRNALVNPRLGTSLAQAREQIGRSREALEGPTPNPEEASARAQGAARALSSAALQMMRNRSDVAGSQSGSGLAEAMERMAQMAGAQGQLNDELGGLIPMLGGGQEAVMQRLRELAGRQRSLANDLERLGESGLPGRPEELAAEARSLAERLEQARLDRTTLERQQRLFRRMLDAGRTLRNNDDDQDPERRSTTASEVPARVPALRSGDAGLRYATPPWADLKDLAPADRALVLDYFRRLNAARP